MQKYSQINNLEFNKYTRDDIYKKFANEIIKYLNEFGE